MAWRAKPRFFVICSVVGFSVGSGAGAASTALADSGDSTRVPWEAAAPDPVVEAGRRPAARPTPTTLALLVPSTVARAAGRDAVAAPAIPAPSVQVPVPAEAAPTTTTAAPPATGPTTSPTGSITYVVQPGDNLSAIAWWFELNGYGDVYDANRHVIGDDPNLIFPGQTFTITGATMTTGTAAAG